ncbi:MAG: glycosyltransferase family 4 protein [Verrucomicrobiota bacterium]
MTNDLKKNSVVLVTHSLDRGGSPMSLWNLARKLEGWNRMVISEKDGPMREKFEQAGCTVRIFPRTGFFQIGLLWNFIRTFREQKADIVHLNTLTSYYKYAAIAAWIQRIPVIWFIRENVTERRCLKLHGWIKKISTFIVPVSREIAGSLYPEGVPSKVRVIYNGIEPPAGGTESVGMRESLGLASGIPLVGCVAALEERKGVADLIEAVRLLKEPLPQFHLVCLGKDRSRTQRYRLALEKQVREADLKDRIHFLGDHPNPLAVYPEFDLFVLPAYWEGCARTLLEAMLQKCPVITTFGGGNPEVILDRKTGLLVQAGDSVALAGAIQTMLTDRPLALSLAEAAYLDWLERFTLDEHVRNVLKVYREALECR